MMLSLKQTITYLTFFTFLIVGCDDAKVVNVMHNVPSMDEVSGIWVSSDTAEMEPSIRNFRGQAVLNRDATSISWFASAPYSGGYHTGVMKLNGQIPMVNMFRWTPYGSLRKCNLDNWEVMSSTRMLPEEDGIMWNVEITNTSEKVVDLKIDLDMIGFISKYDQDEWQWWYPYPKMGGKFTTRDDEVENVRKSIGKKDIKASFVDELIDGRPSGKKVKVKWPSDKEILESSKYKSKVVDNSIFVYDNETEAITAFGFNTAPNELSGLKSGGKANWNLQFQPGEKKVIKYIMAYGDNEVVIKNNLNEWANRFDEKFDNVKSIWEEKWEQIFVPDNRVISGCFPVLETNDTLAKKVYYTGPLTMLYLMNTNLPLHKRLYLTGGPKWGASITFFWDNTVWSTILAVADPAMMKELITSWMTVDPSKNYGQDNFSGKGVGNAYSANYWALFQLVRSYITVTKDYDFLKKKINGKTILETMELYATNWKRISVYGKPGCTDEVYKLADFGDDEWNLLECVPTYKHIIPSFNADYIWMMRETGELYKKLGNSQKADSLKNEASDLFNQLMKLYAGNGVWNALYANNKTIEVRHCMDFMHVGKYLAKDIPEDVKNEMIGFVERELLTQSWMRAQSIDDMAAKNSDRPDHGPMGAYDGWPAGTMDAFVQLGFPQKALDFYHAIEPVTYEGSWAQAHELWGDNKGNYKAKTRIAERGWHCRDAVAGVSMSQVMLECFFGFYPNFNDDPIRNALPVNFTGTMHHVLYGGEYYSITLKDGKPLMKKEKNGKS